MKPFPQWLDLTAPPEVCARILIGAYLVHQGVAYRIVETEAYGEHDPACHAFRGQTPRNRVLWQEPGTSYVYICYGCHHLLNLVVSPLGVPGAVLFRALEMPDFKGRGPGKIGAALQISCKDSGKAWQDLGLQIKGRQPCVVFASPRVGIRVGREKYWRFFDPKSLHITKVKENQEARPIE